MSDTRFFVCPSCHGLNRIPADKVDSHPTCGRCKHALPTAGEPVHLDDDALGKLVRSSPAPVLVDFYADWCAPCRALAPRLAELARRHPGELVVVKVDTDRHPRTAGQLGVRGIPAVYLYHGGRVVGEASGLRPIEAYEQMLAPHLAA